jgi:branched-chain amino acid transport system permease protein
MAVSQQSSNGYSGQRIWWIIALALFFIPLITNRYTQYMINLTLVYIILTVGLNLIFGYTGQFAFANAAFFGVGAYASSLLTVKLGIPFWFSMPLGALAAAVIGCIISIPALRLARFYLAIMTMALGEQIQWVFIHWESMTFGPSGFQIPYPTLGSLAFNSDLSIYYINLLVTLFILWATWNILGSRIGRAFVAIRDSEVAAQCMAIPLTRYKILAYAISAFYAGIAGGLYAITVGFLTPENFGIAQVTLHFCMVMVGGLGSVVGSIAGALVLTSLPEILRDYQAYQEMIFGFILLLILIFMPRGISGGLRRFQLFREKLTL